MLNFIITVVLTHINIWNTSKKKIGTFLFYKYMYLFKNFDEYQNTKSFVFDLNR